MTALAVVLALAAAPRPAVNSVPAPDPRELAYVRLNELKYKNDIDGSLKTQVVKDLLDCGNDLIPILIDIIERGEDVDTVTAIDLITFMSMATRDVDSAATLFIGLLQDNSMYVRISATLGLVAMNVDLQDAVWLIVDKVRLNIKVGELRKAGSMLLGRIGKPALAPLMQLAHEGGEPGMWAVATLARLGDDARPALPILMETLRSPDDQLRSFASATVFSIGLSHEDGFAVDVLVQCLDDKLPEIRERAAKLLGTIGPAALSAVPEIRRRLRIEKDGKVSLALVGALQDIAASVGVEVPTE